MSYLVLVRHGESRWNLANKFTGWVDIPLSKKGIEEAVRTAERLKDVHLQHAFASNLERTHETLTIILSRQKLTGVFMHRNEKKERWYSFDGRSEKNDIPIHTTVLLNERYYGRLQGMNKREARRRFGEKKVFEWRRAYDARPPGGESLKDVYARVIPFFRRRVFPFLEAGKNVIVSGHGNVLRAIIKYLEDVPSDHLPHLDLPSGVPLIYVHRKGKISRQDGPFHFDRPVLWDCPNCKI